MSKRPPKLPFAAARVVKASRVLSTGEKFVWLEDYGLDQGGEEGSWASGPTVAERLGMAAATVESYRSVLAGLGLYVLGGYSSAPQGYTRSTRSRYPTMPAEAIPRQHRLNNDTLLRYREILDGILSIGRQRDKARAAVHNAVRKGELVPEPCEVGDGCDGKIEAHHDDYDRPLDVRWLCHRHHAKWHLAERSGLDPAKSGLSPPKNNLGTHKNDLAISKPDLGGAKSGSVSPTSPTSPTSQGIRDSLHSQRLDDADASTPKMEKKEANDHREGLTDEERALLERWRQRRAG